MFNKKKIAISFSKAIIALVFISFDLYGQEKSEFSALDSISRKSYFHIVIEKIFYPTDSIRLLRKNRIYHNDLSVNVSDYFYAKRINVSYERLMNNNGAINFNIIRGDSRNYVDLSGGNGTLIGMGYVLYFLAKKRNCWFVMPNVNARFNYHFGPYDKPFNDYFKDRFLTAGLTLGYKKTLINRLFFKSSVSVLRNLKTRKQSDSNLFEPEANFFVGLGISFK
jgi:hypothetical protein